MHPGNRLGNISCLPESTTFCKSAATGSLSQHSCPTQMACPVASGGFQMQVCSGVRAMHQMQPPLAHRDVKPHNVLVRRHTPLLPAEPRKAQPKQAGARSSSSSSTTASAAERRRQEHAADEAAPLQGSPEQQSSSGRYHAVLMVRPLPMPPATHFGAVVACVRLAVW